MSAIEMVAEPGFLAGFEQLHSPLERYSFNRNTKEVFDHLNKVKEQPCNGVPRVNKRFVSSTRLCKFLDKNISYDELFTIGGHRKPKIIAKSKIYKVRPRKDSDIRERFIYIANCGTYDKTGQKYCKVGSTHDLKERQGVIDDGNANYEYDYAFKLPPCYEDHIKMIEKRVHALLTELGKWIGKGELFDYSDPSFILAIAKPICARYGAQMLTKPV